MWLVALAFAIGFGIGNGIGGGYGSGLGLFDRFLSHLCFISVVSFAVCAVIAPAEP